VPQHKKRRPFAIFANTAAGFWRILLKSSIMPEQWNAQRHTHKKEIRSYLE
jgi:G:T/U-mismatch repair DNA glycosylase